MGTKTTMTAHVFRQRSSLGVAALSGVTGLLLLVSMARDWAHYPRPLLVAWVLFALACVWSVFVRPAVLLDTQGVTVRNILRDVRIPLALVTYVECRWNLRLFVGDRGYTAWAISSQVQRPKVSAGLFGRASPGRPGTWDSAHPGHSAPAPKVTASTVTVSKVTASTVARLIEQAKQEYDESVAQGRLPPAPDGRVRITWVPLVLAVLLLSAIAVVALSLS